jgi:hypothetical protein
MSPLDGLRPHMYTHAIPPVFHWPLKFCGGLMGTCYFLSVLTDNASQVDRIWTFAPTLYTAQVTTRTQYTSQIVH